MNKIVCVQEQISKLGKEKSLALSKGENTKELDSCLIANKEILRVLFTITDGIAVRSFKFNRPILRLMSENNSSGHLVKDTQDYILLIQRILFKFRGIRIINDLTRFLRIGDVTNIDKKGNITIYEVKVNIKTGKIKIKDVNTIFDGMKSGNIPNKQNKRHLIAQMAIIKNRISIPEDVTSLDEQYKERVGVDIIDINFPIKNHFVRIEKLLNQSRKDILVSKLVEDGYMVNIFSSDKTNIKNQVELLDKFKKLTPSWTEETIVKFSNYDTFIYENGEFPRNILPYSVYPFSIKNCVRLMTGDIFIKIYFDSTFLKNKLENSGWIVEKGNYFDKIRNIASYKKTPRDNNKMFSSRDPVLFKITKETPHGDYVNSVLITQVLSMLASFYAVDFLVDAVNKQFEESKSGERRLVSINYLDEKNILI